MTIRIETAMADALSKAGINTAEARLRQIIQEAREKHHDKIDRVVVTARKGVLADPLIEGIVDHLLSVYLEFLAGDQSGVNTQKAIVAGQKPNGAGDGQANRSTQPMLASSELTSRARNGHGRCADHHSTAAAREHLANPPRSLKEMQKARELESPSIFDTYKLSCGHVLARTPFHILPRLRSTHARDTAAIELVLSEVSNPDPQLTPADYLSVPRFQRIIQKAAERANAA